jgi:hypothetical protein
LPFLWSKKPIKNRGRAYYFPPRPPPGGRGGWGPGARGGGAAPAGPAPTKQPANRPPRISRWISYPGAPPPGPPPPHPPATTAQVLPRAATPVAPLGPPQPEKEPILPRILREA